MTAARLSVVLIDLAAHWPPPPPAPAPVPDDGTVTWLGGTIPQWLTVAAAVIAFVWTVFIYARSVADKRKEQPRLVYVLPDGKPKEFAANARVASPIVNTTNGMMRIAWNSDSILTRSETAADGTVKRLTTGEATRLVFQVFNASPEVVSSVYVSYEMPHDSRDLGYTRVHAIEYLAPGAEKHVGILVKREDVEGAFPAVEFVDGSGLRWSHRAGAPVRRIRGKVPDPG